MIQIQYNIYSTVYRNYRRHSLQSRFVHKACHAEIDTLSLPVAVKPQERRVVDQDCPARRRNWFSQPHVHFLRQSTRPTRLSTSSRCVLLTFLNFINSMVHIVYLFPRVFYSFTFFCLHVYLDIDMPMLSCFFFLFCSSFVLVYLSGYHYWRNKVSP